MISESHNIILATVKTIQVHRLVLYRLSKSVPVFYVSGYYPLCVAAL